MYGNKNSRLVLLKSSGKYAKILKNRNIENALLKGTAVITSPSVLLDDDAVYERQEVWRANSKLWSMAEKNYNDGRFYWIIGLYNDKPTDAHWTPGDIVYIPHPLEYVASLMGYSK